MSGKRGQVAVILILVTAAALIFYAVSLNLGRMSQAKTMTTIASDTGASLLGSYMASKGQAIFQTTLGGERKICAWTGIMAAILVIIAIVIIIVTWGVGTHLALAIIAVALAVVSLVVQVAYIQPGLDEMWNDKIWHTMEERDAFVEQGVQKGLSSAVSDNVLVFDANDADMDRVWGLDTDGVTLLDRINRFGFYYNRRLDAIAAVPPAPVMDFRGALDEFLKEGWDGWGIYDENGPKCDPFNANSECNPCCILPAFWTEEMGCAADDDPDPNIYTPNPAGVASMQTTCQNNSPYGANYRWVYDAFRENPTNIPTPFISFREQLGRDDEHQDFEKRAADPNGIQDPAAPPPIPPDVFQLPDTTSYYAADNRTGVFPFFYKVADWKVNLDTTAITGEPFDLPNKPNQCHWCDPREFAIGPCPGGQPPEIPQLVLDAANPPSGAVFNTTLCVDGISTNVPGYPPLAVDMVKLPDPAVVPFVGNPSIGRVIADDDQCAQDVAGDPNTGFWKRGGDRFCSPGGDAWPYYGNGCSKWGTCDINTEDCACGDAGTAPADSWPDDMLDGLVYGSNEFILWAEDILGKSSAYLVREFKNWYPSAAEWIEEGTLSGANNAAACTQCCFVCAEEDGGLWFWYKEIREMRSRLQAWRDTSFAPGAGACRQVWCIPAEDSDPGTPGIQPCPGIPAPEETTFDSNGNGIWGDIQDIVACVNWNANDAGGNAQKFIDCSTACNTANYAQANISCANLPRSLVPGFDTAAYVPTDISELVTCRDVVCPAAPPPPPPTFCMAYGVNYNCNNLAAIQAQINLRIAAGSCADTNPGCVCLNTGCSFCGFKDLVDKSIPEAANQVAKFRKRNTFLNGRLAEMNNIITILQVAEDKFREFLTCPNGPACQLIRARIDAEDLPTGLPYYAIYGWQSEPEEGAALDSGRWHIVKADARIPGKCDRACGVSQDVGSDPDWPRVKTYTKNWGTRRCYELDNTSGVVKMRVSRFDETGIFGTLLFPNAVEIWQPRFSRPDRPIANADGIEAACRDSMAPQPNGDPASLGSYYYGAFMLNDRADNLFCWNLVSGLLASGVTSEACAQYYYHGGTSEGMGFKFVPCQNF